MTSEVIVEPSPKSAKKKNPKEGYITLVYIIIISLAYSSLFEYKRARIFIHFLYFQNI